MYLSEAIQRLRESLQQLRLQASYEQLNTPPHINLRIRDIEYWLRSMHEIRAYLADPETGLKGIDYNRVLMDAALYLDVPVIYMQ